MLKHNVVLRSSSLRFPVKFLKFPQIFIIERDTVLFIRFFSLSSLIILLEKLHVTQSQKENNKTSDIETIILVFIMRRIFSLGIHNTRYTMKCWPRALHVKLFHSHFLYVQRHRLLKYIYLTLCIDFYQQVRITYFKYLSSSLKIMMLN